MDSDHVANVTEAWTEKSRECGCREEHGDVTG